MNAALRMENIVKEFPGTLACNKATLEVAKGEVHCLLGENGAGKSTMMKILSGSYRPDGGTITVDGEPMNFSSPLDGVKAGISTIYQELDLVPDLTVAQNLFLGHAPTRGIFVDNKARNAAAADAIARVGGKFAPTATVGALSVSDQQLTAIARALTTSARIIVMDEPSATLTDHDLSAVFDVIRELVAEGKSVVYISHRLDEIKEIGHRATVMRDGSTVEVFDVASTSKARMVDAMIGRAVDSAGTTRGPFTGSGQLLSIDQATILGVLNIRGISVRPGEIVGLAGLGGAGRSTLLSAVFGDNSAELDMTLHGTQFTSMNPQRAVRLGIGLVPEDRKKQGLLLEMSVVRNAGLAALKLFGINPSGRAASVAREPLQKLGVKFASETQAVGQLSGGNQQKVVLAKWMARGISLLLLDEPTRGLDIGAKADLFEQVRALADSGVGVLMASSELSELTENCNTVWVLHEGKNVAQYDPHTTPSADIARMVVTGSIESNV
ncbi:sugar ABC transporter ATP-binding protein [Rhodococcus fascians]|nr:sugar ABC transporter ATP-binding protein [Rhodococcus fascians]MBY4139800.1 sugar ABC transporter ATP-binding protein [Rhodococcus fascians]MBY4216608.1 sugar ABC transporter ATP-binding protein [Rhodococcus fascians]MBY4224245.1 sugar ABC transporter ATP-binding protein [Rhodococcus fascians]MBY4230321.1 sugar ABC transporter ATP-binding protein [Rhodococcus fascians]